MKKKTRKFFVSAIAFCMAVIISLPSVIVSLPSIVVEAADSPSICVEIECEDLTDKASYVWVKTNTTQAQDASGGGYLYVNQTTTPKNYEGTPIAGASGPLEGFYEVKATRIFEKEATVSIWIRTRSNTGTNYVYTFYSSINGQEYQKNSCPKGKSQEFTWINLSSGTMVKENEELTIELHRLTNQVYFDKIIITEDLDFIPVNGVSLDDNGEPVSVEVGKTATLTATVAPDNATDKTVTWSSDDEAVATVDATGVVTGVSAGEATITATVGGIRDTITVNVTPAYVAQIEGGEKYETLQAAIEAAEANDTITLLDGVIATANETIINSNITLDLNGYTLDMGSNNWISYGDVVDNSKNKAGRLKVDSTKGELSKNNSQMPVYIDGEGYMLASMKAQATKTISMDLASFTNISRPSFGAEYAAKVANGATAAKLQFILRLDWGTVTDGKYQYYQEFSYSDTLVQNVYTNGKAFSVTVNGLTNYAASMKVTELVISDLGVVLENNSFYMEEPSGE